MGNRVSIAFETDGKVSVALFSQDDGQRLVRAAERFGTGLILEFGHGHGFPLQRLEPETVILEFCRKYLGRTCRVMSNYYLGRDGSEGDSWGNGHWIINLDGDEAIARRANPCP